MSAARHVATPTATATLILDTGDVMSATDLVKIYTDGACRGNPGPGGWGVLIRYGDQERRLWGGEAATTNNRMEMTAVIRALEALKRPCRVLVVTDSRYVIQGI